MHFIDGTFTTGFLPFSLHISLYTSSFHAAAPVVLVLAQTSELSFTEVPAGLTLT